MVPEVAEAVRADRPSEACPGSRAVHDRVFAAACVGSFAFSMLVIWRQRFELRGRGAFVLLDDAMISMTYARNLARGDGLVWNAGGPRVEGVTNPLWTGWMALLHLLPIDDLTQPLLVMLSGAVLLVVLLGVVRRLALRAAPDEPVVASWAVVLTATFFPLTFWSLGGLEVALMAILFGWTLLVVLRLVEATEAGGGRAVGRDVAAFGCVALAAVATRIDAAVGLTAIALAAGVSVPKEHRGRVAVLLGVPLVGVIAVVTAARFAYYGEWLPNTYYLKATGTALDIRVAVGARHLVVALWAHLAAFGAVCAAGCWGNRARWARLAATLVVTQLAYSVWVGGDAWEDLLIANRYLCVAIAPAAVLAATGVRRLSSAPGVLAAALGVLAAMVALGLVTVRSNFAVAVADLTRRRQALRDEAADHGLAYLALVVGLVLAAVALRHWSPPIRRPSALLGTGIVVLVIVLTDLRATITWVDHPQLSIGTERMDAAYGLAFQEATTSDATIAVVTAGAAPYVADRPAVDLLGKSDPHIARLALPDAETFWAGHDKFDLRWSVEHWRPDLVNLGLWHLNGANHEILDDLGYHHLAQGVWARDGTQAVDEPLLARRLDDIATDPAT